MRWDKLVWSAHLSLAQRKQESATLNTLVVAAEGSVELRQSFVERSQWPISLDSTANSYGWSALSPFAWDAESGTLSHVSSLAPSGAAILKVRQDVDGSHEVNVVVEGKFELAEITLSAASLAIRRILRLDEDISEFSSVAVRNAEWSEFIKPGVGKIIRAPNLYQDLVYTICTTNIQWSGTKRLVANLVTRLGEKADDSGKHVAFPTPEAVFNSGLNFLRDEIRLGYRSEYVLELSERFADGELNDGQFEDTDLSTEEVHRRLLAIKGVGPYAAATVLLLLGRYDFVPVDSVARSFVSRRFHDGSPVTDAEVRSHYDHWGKWKSLAYWFDLLVG